MTAVKSTKAWRKFVGKLAYPTILLFVVSFLGFLLTFWAAWKGYLPLWVGTLLNAIWAYLLFTPMHEAGHGNIKGMHKKYKSLETTIGWVCSLALLGPYPVFRFVHFEHHRHTNDPALDPDHWVVGKNPLLIFLNCFSIVVSYFRTFWGNRKEFLKTPGGRSIWYQGLIGGLCFNLLFLFLSFQLGWIYSLLLWILPGFIANTFLAFVFDWLPHHPHTSQQRYLDTRIILFPGLSTLLISQNMHLIHHLYPAIPYYDYGKAMEVLQEELEEHGARIEDYR